MITERSRRLFLKSLLASSAAMTFDVDKLLWVPGGFVSVPAPAPQMVLTVQHNVTGAITEVRRLMSAVGETIIGFPAGLTGEYRAELARVDETGTHLFMTVRRLHVDPFDPKQFGPNYAPLSFVTTPQSPVSEWGPVLSSIVVRSDWDKHDQAHIAPLYVVPRRG